MSASGSASGYAAAGSSRGRRSGSGLRHGSRSRCRSGRGRTRTRRDDQLVGIADDRARRGLNVSAFLRWRDDLVRVADDRRRPLHGLRRRPDRRRDNVVLFVFVFRSVRFRGRGSAEAEEFSERGFESGRLFLRLFLRFPVFFGFLLAVLVDFRRGRRRSPDLALGIAGRVDFAGTSGGNRLDFRFVRRLGLRLFRIGAECDFQEREPVADEQEHERG